MSEIAPDGEQIETAAVARRTPPLPDTSFPMLAEEPVAHEIRLKTLRYSWMDASEIADAGGVAVVRFRPVRLGFAWVLMHGAFIVPAAATTRIYLDEVRDANTISVQPQGPSNLAQSELLIPGGRSVVVGMSGAAAGERLTANIEVKICRMETLRTDK